MVNVRSTTIPSRWPCSDTMATNFLGVNLKKQTQNNQMQVKRQFWKISKIQSEQFNLKIIKVTILNILILLDKGQSIHEIN